MPSCGGSAISESSLYLHLKQRLQVVATCPEGGIDESYAQSLGVSDVVTYAPSDFFGAWRSRRHWLHRYLDGVEVVHFNGHWRWEDFFLAKLCVRKGIPYVLHPRGMLLIGHRRTGIKRLYNTALGRFVVKHAARVVALSRYEIDQFAPYGVRPERVVVVPNGVKWEAADSPVRAATEVFFGSRIPYFLYLGRIEARKNLVFLVESFKRYVDQAGQGSLVLVGPVEHGYDARVRACAEALGLSERVIVGPGIYGADKWFALSEATALIYPTLNEPYGRVPFEAVSVGTVPIVPDASGSAEYLRPFFSDFIYREGDHGSLAAAMQSAQRLFITGESPAGMARAQKWVGSELSWDRIADRVVGIYEELLGGRGGDTDGKWVGATGETKGARAGSRSCA